MAACARHVRLLRSSKLAVGRIWTGRMNLSMLAQGRVLIPKYLNTERLSSNRILYRKPHIVLVFPSLYNSTDTSSEALLGASNEALSRASLEGGLGISTETLSSSPIEPLLNSSPEATSSLLPLGYLPEPPLPVAPVEALNALGEPTLASVGLGNYTPSGFVQICLEALHVDIGLPWWGAIVAGTIIVRTCMFPIVVLAQKNAANMNNHMPTIVRLQQNFSDSRQSGNPVEAARAGNELMEYMQRNKVKPFRNFLVPLAQMPVFISVFVGLRGMANLPVESLTTGGILWFQDLTLTDPYYALPLLTMGTLLATIELGVDGVKAGTMTHTMKWVFRCMPVILLPVISGFPSAMLCYWFTSNAFSMIQVLFLKIPAIRDYLNIPQLVKHEQSALPKKKGFVQGFQDSWNNAKTAAQIDERQKVDALKFKEAGLGAIQKTYSYNPKAIVAKSADKSK